MTYLSNGLLDDQARKITTSAEIDEKYAELRSLVWGSAGPPTDVPTVTAGVVSPVSGLTNLASVDQLDFAWPALATTGAITVNVPGYHFKADTGRRNRVALCSGGHLFDDNLDGVPYLIQALLMDGWDVMLYYMPGYTPTYHGVSEPGWGTVDNPHVFMMNNVYSTSAGSSVGCFLAMPTILLNYATLLGMIDPVSTGFSGGGWSSTWLSAIDRRIVRSVAIEGSLPLYMRAGIGIGDLEQTHWDWYHQASWIDLYILAAQNRRHLLINGTQDFCFGPPEFVDTTAPRTTGLTWSQAVADFVLECHTVLAAAGTGALDESTLVNTTHEVTSSMAAAAAAYLVAP